LSVCAEVYCAPLSYPYRDDKLIDGELPRGGQ
jgi:hypothetical protein